MQKIKKLIVTLLCVFPLINTMAMGSVQAQDPVEGGTLVVSTAAEPETYNPNAAPNNAAKVVIENVMNKLLKINGYSEIVPDIAESYEFSEDGLNLTFHLTPDVKWHDGEPFSAEDVKWTFDQILSEEGFAASSLADIEEVEVIDENTVNFKLSEPNAGILSAIAWHGTQIMPKHIYEGTDWLDNEANQHPIGTGPFKFKEHIPGDYLVLEKNEEYFKEGPYLDEVVVRFIPDGDVAYQAFLNGETDENRNGVPADEIPTMEENEDYVVTDISFPNMGNIVFNMKDGIFTDKKLREAVLYAIDRQDILEKNYRGNGSIAEYYIPYQYAWALNEDAKVPERDVERARELIEEAGYELNEDGYYFETTIDTYPGWDNFVPILAQQLEEVGIKLNHNSMDDGSYDEKVLEQQDFELTMHQGYIGPDISALAYKYGTGQAMNYGIYSSETMDALLEEGNREVDPEKRAEIYREIQALLAEELPTIPTWNWGAKLVTKAYVKGHPMADQDSRKINGEIEFTNVWLDNTNE